MQLLDVYKHPGSEKILWELLQERTPEQSISHREMPTWERHCLFIESHPYIAWYLIEDKEIVGSVYLTHHDEIGVFVFNNHKGKGYASDGIRLLMEKHPRDRYLANINPLNQPSINLFQKLGFTHIQNTYEL